MSTQDAATSVAIRKQQPDLRRQGAFAALLSALGTVASIALWAAYGLLPGLLALTATFVLLVALLVIGAARASRARRGEPAAVNRESRGG